MSKHLVFGIHAVAAILTNKPTQIEQLLIFSERNDQKMAELIRLAKAANVLIKPSTRKVLDQLTDQANHQGVVAYLAPFSSHNEYDLPALLEGVASPLVLVLDGVQDPHNLGAVLRSADAAGVCALIVPKDNAVGMTAAVIKVASGAAFTVPFVQVTNLVRALEELKKQGLWIYGADGEAQQNVYQADLSGPAAIVMGAEGKGLRRLTREHCDVLVKIPMFGTVESLNVSVATGIFLFEAVRQRL